MTPFPVAWPGTPSAPDLVRSKWGPLMVRRAYEIPDNWIVHEVLHFDDYQLRRLPNGIRTVIDVGANIGAAALAIRCVAPQAHIICLEADPHHFDVLKRNAALDQGVECLMKAGARPGVEKITFISTLPPGSSSEVHATGDSHVGSDGDPRGTVVEATSVDDIMDQKGWSHLDLLKLDCEGSEHEILPTLNPSTVSWVVGEWHGRDRFFGPTIQGWKETHELKIIRDGGEVGTFWLRPRPTIPLRVRP